MHPTTPTRMVAGLGKMNEAEARSAAERVNAESNV
jgi:hypothetical protein